MKTRWRILCGALGMLTGQPSLLLAQSPPPDPRVAMPERPTVATHAHTVAVGYVEIETGIQAFHPEIGETEYDTPSLMKIGLGRRLQFDVYEGVTALSGTAVRTIGLGDVSTGIKWRLLDGGPVVGDFAVQPTIKLPTGSAAQGTGTGTTDMSLTLISSHATHGASLDVNVGFTARSGDGSVVPTRAMLWTVSGGVPLRGAVGWTAEVFGYPGTRGASGKRPTVALLTGPTFVLFKFLVLDAGAIFGLAGPQATSAYAGLTWNIGRLWRSSASAHADARRKAMGFV